MKVKQNKILYSLTAFLLSIILFSANAYTASAADILSIGSGTSGYANSMNSYPSSNSSSTYANSSTGEQQGILGNGQGILNGDLNEIDGQSSLDDELDPYADEDELSPELEAVADKDSPLMITQDKATLTSAKDTQTYKFAFTPQDAEKEDSRVFLEMQFEEGFTPKSISTGNWTGYASELLVHAYDKNDEEVFSEYVYGLQTVDLQQYADLRRIRIQTIEPADGNMPVNDVSVTGEFDSDLLGKEFHMKGRYADIAESGEELVLARQDITTICNEYTAAGPVFQIDPKAVDYLGSTRLIVNGISGKGISNVKSFRSSITLPKRMFVDTITFPSFKDAEFVVLVDGTQLDMKDSSVYVNRRATELVIDIKPLSTSFTQEKNMVIEMRNAEAQAADEILAAYTTVVYGKDISGTVKSTEVPVHFNAASDNVNSGDKGNNNQGSSGNHSGGSSGNHSGGSSGNHSGGSSGTDVFVPPIEAPSTPNVIVPSGGSSNQGSTGSTGSNNVITPGTQDTTTSGNQTQNSTTNSEEKKEPAEQKVLDFSGLNLMSAKATESSTNKIIDFRTAGSASTTSSVARSTSTTSKSKSSSTPTVSRRLDTTEIIDFTNKESDTAQQVDVDEFTANTEVEDGTDDSSYTESYPVDDIEMTPGEKVKTTVQKVVVDNIKQNRVLQVVLGLIAIMLIGLLVTIRIFRKEAKADEKEEAEAEAEAELEAKEEEAGNAVESPQFVPTDVTPQETTAVEEPHSEGELTEVPVQEEYVPEASIPEEISPESIPEDFPEIPDNPTAE